MAAFFFTLTLAPKFQTLPEQSATESDQILPFDQNSAETILVSFKTT